MWKTVKYFSLVCFILGQVNTENCLRELPMSELLRIKKSLEELTCDVNSCDIKNDNINPQKVNSANAYGIVKHEPQLLGAEQALPLTGRSLESWDEKPSKIQSVFQLSITALSFLAFGGYLLCMIVQAIKSKGTTYFHPTVSGGMDTSNGSGNIFRRVKIYGRSRRSIIKHNPTMLEFEDETMVAPSPDELYQTMIQFSEKYVKIS